MTELFPLAGKETRLTAPSKTDSNGVPSAAAKSVPSCIFTVPNTGCTRIPYGEEVDHVPSGSGKTARGPAAPARPAPSRQDCACGESSTPR